EDPHEEVYRTRADRQILSLIAAGNPVSWMQAAGYYTEAYNELVPQPPYFGSSAEEQAESFRMPSLLQADPAPALYTSLNLRTVITSTIGTAASPGLPGVPGGAGAALTWQAAHAIRGPEYQEELVKAERSKRARV